MSTPRIVIAGAGLAGLTLGRCLLFKGIRTLIFENVAPSLRRHDYSIDLYSRAYKPLLEVCHIDEEAFLERLSVSPRTTTEDVSTTLSPTFLGDNLPDRFRCHRGRLEALLGEGLDIRWDHAITNVSLNPQHVNLHIKNNPSIETAVFVATDGVHSIIRKSLLPDANPELHPYAVFYGTRSIPHEIYTRAIAPQMQGRTTMELRRDDVLLRIFINNSTSATINLGYTYSRPARSGAIPDPLYKPNRPTNGATDIPEAFYTELSSLGDLESGYAEIFDPGLVRRDRVLHWLMRSMLPEHSRIQALADRGVVMIGDAVHAMPILGSEGANMAIKDGVQLAGWIAERGVENVGEFVQGVYRGWRDCVEESVKRLGDMHRGERAVF